MKSSTHNQERGTLKSKSLMDLLGHKVELKKELIRLKKAGENHEKQEELSESISDINEFLSKHRIQK
tara:strand:- start:754 stop:954 length:201 start_codon:yes stop_codon:yes gene_type:complete